MSDASIPIPTAIAKWTKRALDAEKERDHLRAEVERLTTHSGALESALFAKTSEFYPDLRSELDCLRSEKEELETLSAERLMRLQTRNGDYRNLELNFDKLSAKTKAELDRLRAEKAEMRAALQKISDWKTDGYEVAVAREALAKVNERDRK